MDNQEVLILGGSGILGQALLKQLGDKAIGTYCSTPFKGGVHFDALNDDHADLLDQYPKLTHCYVLIGNAKVEECARDPQGTRLLNVVILKHILHDLLQRGIKPIFTSSETVFDGEQGNYTEADTPRPIIVYGQQKREVELYLLGQSKPFLIVRVAKVLGTTLSGRHPFSEWCDDLEKRQEFNAAHDQYFSPIGETDAARMMIQLADYNGIYHVGGPNRVSRLQLLQAMIREVQEYRPEWQPKVNSCSLRNLPFLEARPLDCSLDSGLYFTWQRFSAKDHTTLAREFAHNEFGYPLVVL